MHRCIVMYNDAMCVLILQMKYRCIIYRCVSINKFSIMDKSLEEIPLYSMVIGLDLYSRRLSYHFQLPNDHTKCSSF